jgi:hypothetical protein
LCGASKGTVVHPKVLGEKLKTNVKWPLGCKELLQIHYPLLPTPLSKNVIKYHKNHHQHIKVRFDEVVLVITCSVVYQV